jgi:hypothetical protein
MIAADGSSLPPGVGQLPDWWLQNVEHDTLDDVLRKQRRLRRTRQGLPVESEEEESIGVQQDKEFIRQSLIASGRAGSHNALSVMAAAAAESDDLVSLVSQDTIDTDGDDGKRSSLRLSVNMSREEEEDIVEARRDRSLGKEEFGQDKLRHRPGSVKTVESVLLNRDQYGNLVGSSAKATGGPNEVAEPRSTKEFKTDFTGVSSFDFAMQQRAREKERREKEREAREALAKHHGTSVEADKAAEQRAKEQEERRKRLEAEANLKAFKAADLDKKYEVAAELKKLQLEDKLKKKEANEHLKGYRER